MSSVATSNICTFREVSGSAGGGGVEDRTVREGHCHLEQASCPNSLLLPGDTAFPDLQIENTLLVALGFRIEAERVILPPLLAVCQEEHQ